MIGSMKLLLCQEVDPTPPLNRASFWIQTLPEKQLREWLWNFSLPQHQVDGFLERKYSLCITYISDMIVLSHGLFMD